MSGGHFDYQQYNLNQIIDSIERELNDQGNPKPKSELYGSEEYYENYPEELIYPTYSEKVNEKFKEAIKALKTAYVYAQRIDWFLSGDDGEETFLKRLKKELGEIK